ncbi:MAG: sugar phosphate nucleotidyltransferase [Prevotella sp.]|nr:sugar phosphate nucleotidyltransferase [Prevotella sp.]
MDLFEMNYDNYCVILAGGKGKRLWPCSRNEKPKQFLDFFGQGKTQLQQTYDRIAKFIPKENILISTMKDYQDIVREQLPEVAEENIMVEPINRNTGPAVSWATIRILKRNANARMMVTPSDQMVINDTIFANDMMKALDYVGQHDVIMTMGIRPTRPEPGYGYIQLGNRTADEGIYNVQSFVEKPEREFAQMFMTSGEFLWNTGLFLSNASFLLQQIAAQFETELEDSGVIEVLRQPDAELTFIEERYSMLPNISIDYAVLERSDNVEVMKCSFGWADLGTWHGIYECRKRSETDNVVIDSDVMMENCRNCVVKLPKDRLAVIHGLEGYIVAEHDNVLLICPKEDSSAMIKKYLYDIQMKRGDDFV